MEIEKYSKKIQQWLITYRYPIIIVLIGLVLLAIPGKKEIAPQQTSTIQKTEQKDMTQQLSEILSKIEGVGKVEIMLTVQSGEKTYYQRDEDRNGEGDSSSVRQDTVILTDGERNQYPLISQVLPPEYLGAVIVCQGADKPAVKWAIVEAVSKATGLGADQISVLKMK